MHDGTIVAFSAGSAVSHPAHYLAGGLEVWDICEAHGLGHHLSSALEYILRARFKGREREDLRKAAVWIGRALEVRARLKVPVPPRNAMWGIDPPNPSLVAKAFGLGERMERVVSLILAPEPTHTDLNDAVHWLDLEASEVVDAAVLATVAVTVADLATVAVAVAAPGIDAALGWETVSLAVETPADDRLALAVLRLDVACAEAGLHWLLAKGRIQHDEPLWGLGIFSASNGLTVDSDVALVLSESDTPEACIDIALDMLAHKLAEKRT